MLRASLLFLTALVPTTLQASWSTANHFITCVVCKFSHDWSFGLPQATDQRGLTPLLTTFRNGHIELVDWLLGHVTHLPSDLECQKALMAPTPPDTDLLPQRSKCLEMIMKVSSLLWVNSLPQEKYRETTWLIISCCMKIFTHLVN